MTKLIGEAAGPPCEHCGKKLAALRWGRPKRFCNQKCRQAAHRAKNAPSDRELRVELWAYLAGMRMDLQDEAVLRKLLGELSGEKLREAHKDAAAAQTALRRLIAAVAVTDKPPLAPLFVTPEPVTETPVREKPAAAAKPGTSSGTLSGGFRLTDEQTAIVDACRQGLHLVVQAGAGTGKTSTLKAASGAMPGRGLYLAFNKAIAQDARKSFPKSTDCRTAHSLAYAAHGKQHKHRLGRRVPAKRTAELLGITDGVKVARDKVLQPFQLARLVTKAVDAYCHSADPVITEAHVPVPEGLTPQHEKALRRELAPYALRLWEETQDPRSELLYTHDCYLKAWALTEPKLPYDYVLFDEAQDANPLLAHLILSQDGAQKIAVGDTCQAIYGWRGAVDAMETWPADTTLKLQQSFRFGRVIAGQANRWLSVLDAPIRLVGNPDRADRLLPTDDADAVLCRTNAAAFGIAMEAITARRRVALVGGGDQIRQLGEAALDLQAGRPTSHADLVAFTSWGQLVEYAEQEEAGADLRAFVRLIEDHGAREVVRAVNALSDERAADLVVSTAHKAKGREWRTVAIGPDFPQPRPKTDDQDGPGRAERRDEMMTAYVAVTRAKFGLYRGSLAWIDGNGMGGAGRRGWDDGGDEGAFFY